MPRLLFEKKGNAVWISHLDLMRVFQRAFKRAELPLKHTQGFNPRPSVSIALPLSVGVESGCELLDFELDNCEVSCAEIKDRLNDCMISGVTVIDVYEGGRKTRDLAFLKCAITIIFDEGVPTDGEKKIRELFSRENLMVPKKTKSGIQEQDIIPMIRKFTLAQTEEKALQIEATICCQNPTLNPMQIPLAISVYCPDLKFDFSFCNRLEVLDKDEVIFR